MVFQSSTSVCCHVHHCQCIIKTRAEPIGFDKLRKRHYHHSEGQRFYNDVHDNTIPLISSLYRGACLPYIIIIVSSQNNLIVVGAGAPSDGTAAVITKFTTLSFDSGRSTMLYISL